jgi:hypothetical protein
MHNKTIDFSNNEIVGAVRFGEGCVIHPTCSIIAEGGSEIVFGNFNIIEVQGWPCRKRSSSSTNPLKTPTESFRNVPW